MVHIKNNKLFEYCTKMYSIVLSPSVPCSLASHQADFVNSATPFPSVGFGVISSAINDVITFLCFFHTFHFGPWYVCVCVRSSDVARLQLGR